MEPTSLHDLAREIWFVCSSTKRRMRKMVFSANTKRNKLCRAHGYISGSHVFPGKELSALLLLTLTNNINPVPSVSYLFHVHIFSVAQQVVRGSYNQLDCASPGPTSAGASLVDLGVPVSPGGTRAVHGARRPLYRGWGSPRCQQYVPALGAHDMIYVRRKDDQE